MQKSKRRNFKGLKRRGGGKKKKKEDNEKRGDNNCCQKKGRAAQGLTEKDVMKGGVVSSKKWGKNKGTGPKGERQETPGRGNGMTSQKAMKITVDFLLRKKTEKIEKENLRAGGNNG